MMQPKTRKERVAEYGSFLYCPKKDTLCSDMDSDDGICVRSVCYLEDPEYIKLQERIAEKIRENARREQEEKAKEIQSPPAPIRRQTKTGVQLLEEQIKKREAKARSLYRANKPRAADSVMRDVMALQAKLRKMRGA